MTFVFVVTYQSVLYTEEMYDYKDFMLDPVQIIGVFTTKEKAEDFIPKYAENERYDFMGDDGDRYEIESFESRITDHCSIIKTELDKSDF